jgi:hypothetical protein
MAHADVLKHNLLRIPLTAYRHAVRSAEDAGESGDEDLSVVYRNIAEQLIQEGYAPDPSTGDMGPATRAYYENFGDAPIESTGSTSDGSDIL